MIEFRRGGHAVWHQRSQDGDVARLSGGGVLRMPEQRLRRAEERVKEYLTRFGVDLASAGIAVEPGLG